MTGTTTIPPVQLPKEATPPFEVEKTFDILKKGAQEKGATPIEASAAAMIVSAELHAGRK